jgi:hypothetical protein
VSRSPFPSVEGCRSEGARLLVGAAVSVLEVTQHRCTASVKGDTATHAVTFDGDRWSCDRAAVGPCSHVLAVARVVVPVPERVPALFVSGRSPAGRGA